MSQAEVAARIVKPEVLGTAAALSELTQQLERAYHSVRALEQVDVTRPESVRGQDGVMVRRNVLHHCQIAGSTRTFVDGLADLLNKLVRESIKYDGLVDELMDQRDSLKRECEDLTKRIANVRRALIASE